MISLSQCNGEERAMLAALYQRLMRRLGVIPRVIEPTRLTAASVQPMPVDAIVGRMELAVAEQIGRRVPLILTTHGSPPSAMRVVIDDAGVGRSAAEYFLDRSFEHFAYVGGRHVASRLRHDAFAARLSEAGMTALAYLGPDTGVMPWSPTAVDRQLTRWVRELPAPTAVLAESDLVGFRLPEICRHDRIAISDQLSIVGVGNDELMCRLCHPPLTTIATPTDRIGRAAERQPDPHGRRGGRRGIAVHKDERAKTDLDRRHRRRDSDEPPHARTTILSRDGTEPAGRDHTGPRGASESLLAYSRSPIGAIAQLSGFSSTQRFPIVFRHAAGATPQAYRQQFQNVRPQVAGRFARI